MNIKKKLKKFFTLQKRANDGFTLVELIIVIAILAILAGAAVPAYNGYIEKAAEAADQQLLAAVNKAFASACLEQGFDSVAVGEASIRIDSQLIRGLADVELAAGTLTNDTKLEMAEDFMLFMLGNETMEFKNEAIKSLAWSVDHFEFDFTNVAVPVVVFSNGQMATLDQAALNAIAESFIGDLTAEELNAMFEDIQDGAVLTLLGAVDETVAGMGTAVKIAYNILKRIANEEQLGAWVALQSTGLKNNTEVFGDRYDYINSTLGDQFASAADREAAMNEFNNAMLLYTAGTLGNGKQDAATIQNNLKNNYNSDTDLVSTGGNGAKVVSAAIRETAYQGYLKTEEGAAAYANATGTDAEKKAALTQDESFNKYLESEQCGNDIAGLIASMETIQANKNQIGTSELVQQGMSNEDASKLFGAVIG